MRMTQNIEKDYRIIILVIWVDKLCFAGVEFEEKLGKLQYNCIDYIGL